MRKLSQPAPRWFAREWLTTKGVKQAQIVERTGHSKSEISDWISGKRRYNADVLDKFARVLGISPADLLRKPEAAGPEILLVGKVGAGAEIARFDSGVVLEDVKPSNSFNAAIISGDSQYPFQEGWLVLYGPEHQGIPEECIGKLCVVQVKDGPVLLKTLKRGTRKGFWRLESWNAPPREDVRLEWAALVTEVRLR